MWTLLSKLTGVIETTFPIQKEQKKEQKAQGWKGGEKTSFGKEKHGELGFLSLSLCSFKIHFDTNIGRGNKEA